MFTPKKIKRFQKYAFFNPAHKFRSEFNGLTRGGFIGGLQSTVDNFLFGNALFFCPFNNGKIKPKLRHVPGRLSMAHSGHKDSAGTQFFICTGPQALQLDGKYTCFGEVTRGMDVVYTIAETEVNSRNKPLDTVVIDDVVIKAVKSRRR